MSGMVVSVKIVGLEEMKLIIGMGVYALSAIQQGISIMNGLGAYVRSAGKQGMKIITGMVASAGIVIRRGIKNMIGMDAHVTNVVKEEIRIISGKDVSVIDVGNWGNMLGMGVYVRSAARLIINGMAVNVLDAES